ncbi:MAG: hypothetical protein QOJ25_1396 [Solirubrobacteraceae bacterium]|nr:hypothetical protein [Solirubrobacteraceae bacterium]
MPTLAGPGRETQLTVTSPAQARSTTGAVPQTDVSAALVTSALREGASRDFGVASAARRTAFIVGSRAREAILGYGFATPEGAPAGPPPRAGEEPSPGQTMVLVGDEVETWVRERLYGGRLPVR